MCEISVYVRIANQLCRKSVKFDGGQSIHISKVCSIYKQSTNIIAKIQPLSDHPLHAL